MELLGLSLVVVLVVGIIVLTVRGMFARDLTQAIRRVAQQELELQQKADLLEGRLQQIEQDHALKMKQAEVEGQRLLQDASEQAANIRAAAIEEAKQHARQLMAETEHARAQLRRSVVQELNGRAIEGACRALATLLSEAETANLHEQLMARLIGELERVEGLTMAGGSSMTVRVRSARPLSERQLQEVAERLGRRLGAVVRCEAALDASLVAGCDLACGDMVIHGSLRHYVGRLAQAEV